VLRSNKPWMIPGRLFHMLTWRPISPSGGPQRFASAENDA
jgi:hypothetical protein